MHEHIHHFSLVFAYFVHYLRASPSSSSSLYLGCVFDFAYGMMAFIKHEAFGLEARPRSCVTAQAQAQQVCKSQVTLVESSLDIKVFNCSVF